MVGSILVLVGSHLVENWRLYDFWKNLVLGFLMVRRNCWIMIMDWKSLFYELYYDV